MSLAQPPRDLTRGTLRGLSWVYGGMVGGALAQLVYTAVMGRLLTPGDFGLVAMAMVFQRFASYFAQMGVGQALIQKADVDETDVRVGFSTSVILGVLFTGAIFLAAPLAGAMFATDAVVPVVRVMSLTFLFGSLGWVSTGLLRRDLRFRALSLLEFATYSVAFLGVGITMAVLGFGVWSLVGAQLAQSILMAAGAYAAARHRLAPHLSWQRIAALYGYGSRISVIGFLQFLGSNLDSIIIGRYAGEQRLGQYNRAFLLVNLPFQHLVHGLSRVLFPSFSRIQAETARLRGAYRSGLAVIAALLLPAAAGLAVAAPEVVRVVIGPQWGPAAAVLPVLAGAAALTLLSHLAGVICDATAALNRKLAIEVAHVVIVGALLLGATAFDDLVLYAWALLAAQVMRYLLYMRMMGTVLNLGVWDHLRLYAPSVGTAALIAVGVGALTVLLRPFVPVGVVLAGQVTAGGLILGISVLWGPLAATRRELGGRLRSAGLLSSERPLGRLLRTAMDLGR